MMNDTRSRMLGAIALLVALSATPALAIDDVEYNAATGHYYKYYSDSRTWASARAEAVRLGGYLAVVTSTAEHSFLTTTVGTTRGWLGGTDEVTEGTWVWVNGETWSFTNWNANEPNNVGASGEHYLELSGSGWNDHHSGHVQPYIVEWDRNPNISTPPEAPTGLVATVITDRRVDLTWADTSDIEDSVEVERSVDGGAYSRIAQLDADAIAFSDTTALGGTEHSYRVRMTNFIGAGQYSNVVTLTTPPSPLQDFAATSPSNTSVQLTWTDASDEETGVIVERGLGCPAASFSQIASLPANSTSFDDEGLDTETAYSYRIRATRAAGAFEYSPVVCITTPPADPAGFEPTVSVGADVTLTWFDGSNSETGFEIERGIGCPTASFTLLVALPPDTTTHVDTTTEPETTYEYRVRSVSESGVSAWTPVACVTTPPYAPILREVVTLSTSRVRLTWDDVSAVEDGFRVTRANYSDEGSDAPFRQVADVAAGAAEFIDDSATQDGSYAYRIAAFDSNGQSEWAVSDDVETPAVLIAKKISLKLPKAGSSKPAKVTIDGEFDVGTIAFDFTQPAVVGVGDGLVNIPSLSRKGSTLRHTADGIRLDLKPGKGSSRVVFKLIVVGDVANALPADGDVTLTFRQGTFSGSGVITMARSRFLPGKFGNIVDPPLRVSSISAKVKLGAKDVLKVKSTFDATGGVPEDAPDVTVKLGFFEFEVTSEQFTPKGNKFVFKQKGFGSRKVTLDYAKGTISIAISGVELGTPGGDGIPVRFAVGLGPLQFASRPVLSGRKRSLKY